MFLKNLSLKQFRNYETLQLTFDQHVTLFVGQNAQGKTNILESIYVLALAKSHRTTKDRDLIQWDQPFAVIKGEVEQRFTSAKLELQLTQRGKKAKLNGIEQRKLSDYVGALNVVMFAPEDLEIVKGSPSIRRRFIDMEIGQVSPAYLYTLTDYNKLISQRNQLLKDFHQHQKNLALLEVWNQQMAEMIVKILKKRYSFVDQLQKWANTIHQQITDGKETLSIQYNGTIDIDPHQTGGDVADHIFQKLEEIRQRELMRGTSLIGPHRDDLSFYVNGIDVQQFGSQGQQRTTALSIKLAELELIKEEVGEYPVLLLDDVLSELDEFRQTQLLDAIQDRVQTFVTTTGVEGIHHQTLDQASVFRVTQGSVTGEH